MTKHIHLKQLKRITMTSLTLTICGAALLTYQQDAHAATDESNISTVEASQTQVQTPISNQITATTVNQQAATAVQNSTQVQNAIHLYSNNLATINNTQNINFPAGYTLSAVANVHDQTSANQLEKTAIQGLYQNNYQSDPEAAQESVNIQDLTNDQISQINTYGLNLVNRARAEFGKQPFTQNNGAINATRNMALQYQAKNESLLFGDWHDYNILNHHSENIAAFQVYDDNIAGLTVRPFASAKGYEFANENSIPLFKITTMDDMQAMIYYGIMGMLFNDASDLFGHAQNFLVFYQPINSMALYPSITFTINHNGRWSNGQSFSYRLTNVDMHYIWVSGNNDSRADFSNNRTTSSWNTNDQGNYACLDNANLTTNGQLIVSGWHATNANESRPYHYLILLDQNNHEITRSLATTVPRPDVQRVHNVYNALNAGFNNSFNLSNYLANVSKVTLISRYSSDPQGNNDYVDYWFKPIAINHDNYAYLDSAKFNGNQLTFTGWHATNLAANKSYHYIIILDKSNGDREITRQLVTGTTRPDVANAYQNIYKAGQAGFSASFNVTNFNFNHSLQVISRYSSDPTGNSNYVDYWFKPITINHGNYAYLDNAQVNGNQLTLTGWHATNLAANKPYHYIIIVDKSNGNREVARQLITNKIARPDVANAYQDVYKAGQTGFNVNFNVANFNFNHSLQVISRYSSDPTGNSNYVDYWFNPITPGNFTNQASLDKFTINGNKLVATGWHANSVTNFEQHHFLILWDSTAGRQVTSKAVPTVSRPDVAKVYPNIANAGNSGFNASFDLTNISIIPNHAYTIISRYSSNNTGNGNGNGQQYTDYWFAPRVLKEA